MDYVSFECTHFAEADQGDPDERQAVAYADIDGYPADENKEGTVICRVWLMKEKSGIYPTYLVDWHHNGFRMDKTVLELIDEAKKDLVKFKGDMMMELFRKAYERYKLKWMLENDYTLDRLIGNVQMKLDHDAKTIKEALESLENDCQFGCLGVLYDDTDSFFNHEWQDESYMKDLLTGSEYSLWILKEGKEGPK